MCCCTRFGTEEGPIRAVRHDCCPTHGRPAETQPARPVKASA